MLIERLESSHPLQLVRNGDPMRLDLGGAAARVLQLTDARARAADTIVSRGEQVPGTCAIAAPIFNHRTFDRGNRRGLTGRALRSRVDGALPARGPAHRAPHLRRSPEIPTPDADPSCAANGRYAAARSKIAAMPCPPPMQSVTSA